jgi:hypothetical protein
LLDAQEWVGDVNRFVDGWDLPQLAGWSDRIFATKRADEHGGGDGGHVGTEVRDAGGDGLDGDGDRDRDRVEGWSGIFAELERLDEWRAKLLTIPLLQPSPNNVFCIDNRSIGIVLLPRLQVIQAFKLSSPCSFPSHALSLHGVCARCP